MKTDMLKHIASFIAVAENKSLTMAAEQLGCSKAHLSQQIKKLEQYYQIQLFLRTTRQLTLSAVGEGFLKECQLAIKIINDAELNLLETKNLLRGEINLTSVGGVIGEQYIAPAVIQFMKMHPNIKVNLDFSSDHRDLIASRYDLAIRMGELVAVLKPWNQSKSPCHLVYPPSKFRLQRVKALAEWIVDVMQ
jgi:DNA-binding transcriptional LysR family regulator